MTKYLRVLVTLVGLAGFGVAAKAQALDQIIVNIPFEFSVAGKTLPAGTYRVNRLSTSNDRNLLLKGVENREGVILTASDVDHGSPDNVEVTFEISGDQHFLSKIDTGNHVFNIPVSRRAVLLASGKSHGNGVTGSTSGNN